MGRFPGVVTHQDSLTQKVDEIRATIKFQMKKVRSSQWLRWLSASSGAV